MLHHEAGGGTQRLRLLEACATSKLPVAQLVASYSATASWKQEPSCFSLPEPYLCPKLALSTFQFQKQETYHVWYYSSFVMTYEFHCGISAFEAGYLQRIMKVDVSFSAAPIASLESESLISQLLVKDSSTRLSPWVKKNAIPWPLVARPEANPPPFMEEAVQRDTPQETRGGRGKWIEDETFSIFVDNLPKDSTKAWLWSAFGRTGKIVDVYLSEKVRKSNLLKFAFIRYRSRMEAIRTTEHLNGWIVWGYELKLYESRYSRSCRDSLKLEHVNEERNQERKTSNHTNNTQPVKTGTTKTYCEALKGFQREEEDRNGCDNNGVQTLGNSKIYLTEHSEAREMLK
ncbi:hypothetical protein PIB30_015503 [Stylosanthes scabra]|uniref:RRM domain-containing protein n=1 Tax=Stylosanthes scabra TaxID=79078 RepID=A0ABU6X8N9_9FABA|nr:hypothetical protein [Stylosanthes scabra]